MSWEMMCQVKQIWKIFKLENYLNITEIICQVKQGKKWGKYIYLVTNVQKM